MEAGFNLSSSVCFYLVNKYGYYRFFEDDMTPPAFEFLFWICIGWVHECIITVSLAPEFNNFTAYIIVVRLFTSFARELLFTVHDYCIMTDTPCLGIFPAHVIKIFLIVRPASDIPEEILPAPVNNKVPDIEMTVMRVIVFTSFPGNENFFRVFKVTSHYPPVNCAEMYGWIFGRFGFYF